MVISNPSQSANNRICFRRVFLFLALFLFISSLFLSVNIPNVSASSSDKNYYFVPAEIELDNESFTSDSYYNLGNPYSYTKNYNSTYTFYSETGESGLDIDFIDYANIAGGTISVIASFDNHDEVLDIHDTSDTESNLLYNNDSAESGILRYEFWVQYDQSGSGQALYIAFREQTTETRALYLCFNKDTNNFKYYNGATWQLIQVLSTNHWYHMSIEINTDTDKFSIWVNTILKIDNVSLENVIANIFKITMNTLTTGANYHYYFDAIGFNYSYYNKGDNIFPLMEINTSIICPMYDEFNFEGINDLYDNGDKEPNGWSNIIGYTGTEASIDATKNHPDKPTWDNIYWFNVLGISPDYPWGFEKNFDVNGNYINVSLVVSMDVIAGDGYNNWTIRSKDLTDVATIYINKTIYEADEDMHCDFFWVDSSDDLHLISENHTLKQYHEFNIIIDYYHDFGYLGFEGNLYSFPLLATGKQGLGDVVIQALVESGGTVQPFFDSVGVFVDGNSFVDDLGFIDANMDKTQTFNRQHHYLYNHTQYGKFTIVACGTNGSEYIPEYSNYEIIANETQYTNQTSFLNIVEISTDEVDYPKGTDIINATIVLFFNDTTEYFSITQLDLKGCYISRDWEERFVWRWLIDYSSETVDINESYVWADADYNLRYRFISRHPSEEFFYLRFEDFPPISALDRAIYFKAGQNSTLGASLHIDYTSLWYDSYQIEGIEKTYAYELKEEEYYYAFALRIFDGDAFPISYKANKGINIKPSYTELPNITTEGYISKINIIYLPDLTLGYTSIALLYVLIPIIVIIVPSFLISGKFGKKAILPMILFMSLVCAISGLIPVWVFIIIALGFIVFIWEQKKGGG